MRHALNYLAALPRETVVYNGHEYTTGSAAFAKHVEPDNPAIGRLESLVKENKATTGLTTIGDEKGWNVFMRLESETIRYSFTFCTFTLWLVLSANLRKALGATASTPDSEVMDKLREFKNNFRS